MTDDIKVEILTTHKENLLKTKTFEEYRDAHVAYIDMLIQQIRLDLAKDESIIKWIKVTETLKEIAKGTGE